MDRGGQDEQVQFWNQINGDGQLRRGGNQGQGQGQGQGQNQHQIGTNSDHEEDALLSCDERSEFSEEDAEDDHAAEFGGDNDSYGDQQRDRQDMYNANTYHYSRRPSASLPRRQTGHHPVRERDRDYDYDRDHTSHSNEFDDNDGDSDDSGDTERENHRHVRVARYDTQLPDHRMSNALSWFTDDTAVRALLSQRSDAHAAREHNYDADHNSDDGAGVGSSVMAVSTGFQPLSGIGTDQTGVRDAAIGGGGGGGSGALHPLMSAQSRGTYRPLSVPSVERIEQHLTRISHRPTGCFGCDYLSMSINGEFPYMRALNNLMCQPDTNTKQLATEMSIYYDRFVRNTPGSGGIPWPRRLILKHLEEHRGGPLIQMRKVSQRLQSSMNVISENMMVKRNSSGKRIIKERPMKLFLMSMREFTNCQLAMQRIMSMQAASSPFVLSDVGMRGGGGGIRKGGGGGGGGENSGPSGGGSNSASGSSSHGMGVAAASASTGGR